MINVTNANNNLWLMWPPSRDQFEIAGFSQWLATSRFVVNADWYSGRDTYLKSRRGKISFLNVIMSFLKKGVEEINNLNSHSLSRKDRKNISTTMNLLPLIIDSKAKDENRRSPSHSHRTFTAVEGKHAIGHDARRGVRRGVRDHRHALVGRSLRQVSPQSSQGIGQAAHLHVTVAVDVTVSVAPAICEGERS